MIDERRADVLLVALAPILEDGFRLAALANAWVRETGDLAEGIAAFFEKRPPRFSPR